MNCKPDDFSDYDGFAIAVFFNSSPDLHLETTDNSVGVCFLRDYNCVYVTGDVPYALNSFSMTHPASMSMPNFLDVDADTDCALNNNGGFSSKCWTGYEVEDGSFEFLSYRYMPVSDDNRYAGDEKEVVWAITFDPDVDNQKNLDFVIAGATQLWTTLGISLSLLFTF